MVSIQRPYRSFVFCALCATWIGCMSVAAGDAPFSRITIVDGGTVSLDFDADILDHLAIRLIARTAGGSIDVEQTVFLELTADSSLSAEPSDVPMGEGVWQGELRMRGAMLFEHSGGRIALVDPTVHAREDGSWVVTSVRGRQSQRREAFRLSTVIADLPRFGGPLQIAAELELAEELADELGISDASGLVVGTMRVDADSEVHELTASVAIERDLVPGLGGTLADNGPDVIVADLHQISNYGSLGGIAAFAVGTVSCNAGDQTLAWFSDTTEHPVIAQNIFRLKDDRFEQIGQSWVKHGFAAINGNACGLGCINPGTTTVLGVGCSDPYSSSLNGAQSVLGPRSEINAFSGEFPYPPLLNPATSVVTGRRVQVLERDLDPNLFGGGSYFVEGQYVAADDSSSGNLDNNNSYRPVSVSFQESNNTWILGLQGMTQRRDAAIRAWAVEDTSVTITEVRVPGEGLFLLGTKVSEITSGTWAYEYAIQNLNSDRSAGSFSVPISPTAAMADVGFHDVPYHSGEVYDGTSWLSTVGVNSINWATDDFTVDPLANALRWGTLYNFRFTSDVPPQPTTLTLGLFKPGTPESVTVTAIGPLLNDQDCNGNGVADSLDIIDETSSDCNGNWIPDECETFSPTPLTAVRVAAGLTSPVYVAAAPGDTGRLFIVEQGGVIKILSGGSVLPTPFLDISSIVGSGGERGLFSVAFHPAYDSNGYFFVDYTDSAGDTVIARYSVSAGDPNVANPGSAVLIKSIQQDFANHNGGQLQFGPDGYLYAGMGDGGSGNDPFNRAQDASSLLGKLLRLDVDSPPDYIPGDNPYAAAGLPLDEIWAFGMRNPWRFSFDRLTADLYIGDVGQDDHEEIDFQPAGSTGGENYGWRCMEGTACTGLTGCTCNDPSLTLPIKTYPTGSDCSITGGYVYRGCAMPDLAGTYFYSDYCSSFIRTLRYVDGVVTDELDRTAELTPNEGSLSNVTSFGEDADGELYIVSHNGDIFKIVPDVGPMCGNGIIETGEQCDDSNTTPGDGCDANCQSEAISPDDCTNAVSVAEGTFAFDNTGATTDGPDEPLACSFSGYTQLDSDIWFRYTTTCSGTATVSLCGSTFDTKLAVYDGASCPTVASAIRCDDDACSLSSEVSFSASACSSYLVRIGGYQGAQGAGTMSITCAAPPPVEDCNDNGVEDAVDIACGESTDADGNGVPDECEWPGRYTRGGLLYDRWWTHIGMAPPTVDHPLWAYRPDPTSNTRTGADTWRCKECHGWDYKGVDGQYGAGSHRTGFPGVLNTTLTPPQLLTILKESPSNGGGAGVLNGHDYGTVLADSDIDDLVSFILLGLIDDDAYIDPASTDFTGDASAGEANYTSGGTITCIVCHGADGTAINFGTYASPEYLGTIAVHNPWEFLHKVRMGQPASPMPSWLSGGGTNQGAADIGRYAQLGFPTDCVEDGQCDDGVACTINTCDLAGRCAFVPDDSSCTEDGVFCNGDEKCDPTIGCVSPGNPCTLPGACDEAGDSCGCDAPAAFGAGPRYLTVTPQPSDSLIPIALTVTPACTGGVTKYVGLPQGADRIAQLVDDASTAPRMTPAEWGPIVYVGAMDIVPETTYRVESDCGIVGAPRLSASTDATTEIWGDVGGLFEDGAWTAANGLVDVFDMIAVVDAFGHLPGEPPLPAVDLVGCVTNGVIDIADIVGVVDGFQAVSYEDSSRCTVPCP